MPHWHYNVDIEMTVELIQQIGKEENTLLAVKAHTRGDGLSQEVIDSLRANSKIDLNAQASSSSLIDWSDIVINFGSSIGLEAIVRKKNPTLAKVIPQQVKAKSKQVGKFTRKRHERKERKQLEKKRGKEKGKHEEKINEHNIILI